MSLQERIYTSKWEKTIWPSSINFAAHLDYRFLLTLLDDVRTSWLYTMNYNSINPSNGIFLTIHHLEEDIYQEIYAFDTIIIEGYLKLTGVRAIFNWDIRSQNQNNLCAKINYHMVAVKKTTSGILKPCAALLLDLQEKEKNVFNA